MCREKNSQQLTEDEQTIQSALKNTVRAVNNFSPETARNGGKIVLRAVADWNQT